MSQPSASTNHRPMAIHHSAHGVLSCDDATVSDSIIAADRHELPCRYNWIYTETGCGVLETLESCIVLKRSSS